MLFPSNFFFFCPEIRNFSDSSEEIITIPLLKARDKFARENSSVYILKKQKKNRNNKNAKYQKAVINSSERVLQRERGKWKILKRTKAEV